MIAIRGIDHIVLSVADIDRSLAFYHGILGLPVEREAQFRAGQIGFPSVRVHDQFVIDLFPRPADQPAPTMPNLNHYCFVTDVDDLAPVREELERRGVRVLRGPVERWGAQGEALSIYLLDPDGNEVEIRTYAPVARAEAEARRAARTR
jgi:catechol 2,3-dioxygenase-like lactoylglutathione lyase family enzyme